MIKKLLILSKRNLKEIIRDPLSLSFCLGFPILMLVLLQSIFMNMESVPENFEINNYAVGICIFGYAFAMLSLTLLMVTDKSHEFINRLEMAPTPKWVNILSYILAMLPVVLLQTVLFFIVAFFFKLKPSLNVLVAIIYLLPSALFYLSLGALIGNLANNEKQAGPISSIIISGVGILGGVFMPIEGLGGFSTFLKILPFSHTVKIASGTLNGDYGSISPSIFVILIYILVIVVLNVLIYKFKKK